MRPNVLSQGLFCRYYLSQKKTLEINPRHPLIKELLKRVEEDAGDDVAKNIATMMYHTGEFHEIWFLRRLYWHSSDILCTHQYIDI